MKQVWSSPKTSFEQFVPQNYIAACGDSGVVYKFTCNAGSKYSKYNVYLENGTPYVTSRDKSEDACLSDYYSYSPCGGTHEAESDSGFERGYMYKQNFLGGDTGDRIDVYIWTENYTNVHCSTDLNMDEWETAKS